MATRQQRKAVLDAQIMACRRCKGMNRLAKLLDASLKIVCFAKEEVFITNGVHGHPPRNHESLPTWIENCSPYLHRELEIVQPTLVIGLGRDAQAALRSFNVEPRMLTWPFTVPRVSGSKTVLYLLFAKHPSWIKRQHDDSLEEECRTSLAGALKWAFTTDHNGAATPSATPDKHSPNPIDLGTRR